MRTPDPYTNAYVVRRLDAGDAAAYRALRLEGLQHHPEAFGASWEEEQAHDAPWFAARLEEGLVLGACAADGALAGAVGMYVPAAAKQRHKGVLWGMYVRPQARGSGVARALLDELLRMASGHVEELRLTVTADNEAARRLYVAAGFVEYAREPRALRVGQRYYDEIGMARMVGRAD
ncbi:GNAT family N-acetyltransferase [Bordetella genomosp. 13]|uniref:GNAT family N-acetyltransferase n=1 Tax=Bordetella genomosp. 13 TaxID=463040 RepID=A0A1W6Z977_9BORD|nr:GNAT family N-acetyltransferase [Bordetella genomosp. 13]ARP93867.1 GNAT family N-acetyltransferase [Bordetella genomosp. 13]